MFAALMTCLVVPSLLFANAPEDRMRFAVEIELSTAWQTVNDVEIPNDDTATRFALNDLIGGGPFPAGRLYLTWYMTHRHSVKLLLAPLKIAANGEFTSPVNFAGETFAAGPAVNGTYRFNSWRLTYRYHLVSREAWGLYLGFTGKIRDAEIKLTQGAVTAEKTNVGFVPLLHITTYYSFTDRWAAIFSADALAGGPGRAEDVSLKVVYAMSDALGVSVGYRTLEGGADVDEVYNFAWLHYAVISLTYRF